MRQKRPIYIYALMLLTAIGCVVCFMGFQSFAAESTNRWDVSPTDLRLKIPVGITNRGVYSVEISRTFADQNEARLLPIAESVYPKKSQVLAARSKHGVVTNADSENSDYLWAFDSIDGVSTAYAITAGAVHYYLGLTDEFRRGVFTNSAGVKIVSSALRYAARVDYRSSYDSDGLTLKDVYVVSMTLNWYQDSDNQRRMAFYQNRSVTLTREGKILEVNADKAPLMSSN